MNIVFTVIHLKLDLCDAVEIVCRVRRQDFPACGKSVLTKCQHRLLLTMQHQVGELILGGLRRSPLHPYPNLTKQSIAAKFKDTFKEGLTAKHYRCCELFNTISVVCCRLADTSGKDRESKVYTPSHNAASCHGFAYGPKDYLGIRN